MKPSTLRFAHQVADLFKAAALAGQRGPSNGVIAEKLGLQSGGFVSRLVAIAEQQGMIVVHRGNCSRVVSAPDGSWRTAGEITNQPWHERPQGAARVRRKASEAVKRGSMRGAAVLASKRAAQVAAPKPVARPQPIKPRPPVGVAWGVDRRGCRWPMWNHTERPTQVFCDRPRDGCRPYCAEHAAKGTVQGRERAA